MVLGDEHDILRTRSRENIRPLVGVEHLRREARREVLVVEVLAVDTFVKRARLAADLRVVRRSIGIARLAKPLPVPLGVFALRCEGGHREHAPVNENAEFRVAPPRRSGPRIDRFPRGLESLRVRCRREDQHQARNCEFVRHAVPQSRWKTSVMLDHHSAGRGSGPLLLHGLHERPPALRRRIRRHRAHVGSEIVAHVFEVREQDAVAQVDGIVADVRAPDLLEHGRPHLGVVVHVVVAVFGAELEDLAVALHERELTLDTIFPVLIRLQPHGTASTPR